jgi:hypothetical protein
LPMTWALFSRDYYSKIMTYLWQEYMTAFYGSSATLPLIWHIQCLSMKGDHINVTLQQNQTIIKSFNIILAIIKDFLSQIYVFFFLLVIMWSVTVTFTPHAVTCHTSHGPKW